ncbi:MAG: hypothetical protein WDM79_08485 [Terricaulis sp.]
MPVTRVRALERGVAELEGRRAELRAMIAATQQDRSEALRDVEARLREATPQHVSAREQVERTRIRAPTAGVVVGLAVHTVGGVIRGGDRLMDIVPAPSRAFGRGGNSPRRRRRHRARPASRSAHHRLRRPQSPDRRWRRPAQLSADRFVNERTGQGYFTAQVSVPEEEINAIQSPTGGHLELRAGLPAQVVVPTRKRTRAGVFAGTAEPSRLAILPRRLKNRRGAAPGLRLGGTTR